ncbi:MAG: hypothetical protein Q8R83_07450 [Legionellaceae bacterium]|nr:hypothetical protein [Legionellaceae bacterium]
MNSKEPIHFSDYFNIDKVTLNKLGVFDSILNFDTKVFVEPLLLKNSTSDIVKNSYQTYKNFFTTHDNLVAKIQQIEQKHVLFEVKVQEKFETIFSALEEKPAIAKQGVFFDGQVFDAYLFVSKLIRSAKKSIIILDNYIDETVFAQLSKADNKVKVYILTKNITDTLKLDLKKYNQQYQKVELLKFGLAHDRFLIIDQYDIYHIGASLKDLGTKWFAFSRLDPSSFGLMEQIDKIIKV